ncbi:hypothetical protein LPJ79_002225 [Coemansia sp. RSA 1821]|nr:hypothetical protein LPJ68_001784 [Coemansia sp. RSA 1086]KAJ1751271.1 hypothetical protein LPJ79_002225 [Coemansia sp. RSA 1821]
MSRVGLSVLVVAAVALAQQQQQLPPGFDQNIFNQLPVPPQQAPAPTQAPAPIDPNNPIPQPSPLPPASAPQPASIPAGLSQVPTPAQPTLPSNPATDIASVSLPSVSSPTLPSPTLPSPTLPSLTQPTLTEPTTGLPSATDNTDLPTSDGSSLPSASNEESSLNSGSEDESIVSLSEIDDSSDTNYVTGGHAQLSDFVVEDATAPAKDQLKDNQVLIRPVYFSVDPYQRGRLSGTKDSYVASYEKGKPITNFLVAEVVASSSSSFKEGDLVMHNDGNWESEYIADAQNIHRIEPKQGVEPRDYVGVLSMPSYTAYYGTMVLGEPKRGETILVSSASGAVGQMVVQLAKAAGLHVVAFAGSDEKVEHVKKLGADVAFNYNTCGDFLATLKKLVPQRIDIYYDNVGGPYLDAALAHVNDHARVIICGAITQYNIDSPDQAYAIKNITAVLVRRVRMQGFIILDHMDSHHHAEFVDYVSKLYAQGKIQYKTYEVDGLQNGPQAILDLFSGKNIGKTILKA